MKPFPLFVTAAAIFASAACNADNGNNAASNSADIPVTATPVAAPNNGDWSTIVSQTPEGGFRMGNPTAQVKLVEFGSMTCPHCADFDETGLRPLIDNYVKKGLVSFEFRNFVRDPYDITAALVARCGGPTSFFGLTRAMYEDQENWIAKVQGADPAALQALQNQPPQAQFKAIADLAGFPAFASMRGVPRARTDACLADPAGASRLVAMNSAASDVNIPGTPSFLIDGTLVENSSDWKTLEPAIKSALNS